MKYSEKHMMKYYEGDANSRMTLPMLLNIAINTSEIQSALLGRDNDYIRNLGITWVITEHEINVTRLPQTNQTITITTEAKEHNKYFCYRHFWIQDEHGEELVEIITTFVLMDMTTRKMVSVPEEVLAPYESKKIKTIRRGIKFDELTNAESKMYHVRFSDIDTNKHVNNSRYFDWMTDSLGTDFLMAHSPKQAIIRFNKEISAGDEVKSSWYLDNEKQSSLHQIDVDGTKCAESKIVWYEQLN